MDDYDKAVQKHELKLAYAKLLRQYEAAVSFIRKTAKHKKTSKVCVNCEAQKVLEKLSE